MKFMWLILLFVVQLFQLSSCIFLFLCLSYQVFSYRRLIYLFHLTTLVRHRQLLILWIYYTFTLCAWSALDILITHIHTKCCTLELWKRNSMLFSGYYRRINPGQLYWQASALATILSQLIKMEGVGQMCYPCACHCIIEYTIFFMLSGCIDLKYICLEAAFP